jgi:hypothetical protein
MNITNNTFMSTSVTQNASFVPTQFAKGATNPFSTQINSVPFDITQSPREFVPSAEKTRMPVAMNNNLMQQVNINYTSEQSMTLAEDVHGESNSSDGKYKTEMCKNWIENNNCRYGKKFQFAHGYEELAAHSCEAERKRTKNCRTFYKTKVCNYGSRCMFRHEHRRQEQIMRHYYFAKLYTAESLFQYSKDRTEFINSYDSGLKKLSVFEAIHA